MTKTNQTRKTSHPPMATVTRQIKKMIGVASTDTRYGQCQGFVTWIPRNGPMMKAS